MTESLSYKSALSKAMALCSRREYCSSEIREKLSSRDLTEKDIENVLSTLKEEKFIDELRFARAFARDKFNYNKWGRIKISSQLKIKRIPSDIIREALESIDEEQYEKLLRNLIQSHKKRVKARNEHELKAKLIRYGLSKGFETSLLFDILGGNQD